MTEHRHEWWQRGVVYQVYPRSFRDSNGDGIGDLPGVRSKLDYLQWLAVDALWLSPIYPSPMADFGYDITDYTDIHPIFGTLADFDALVADAHRRGLRVILDFVPNHTSLEHPWFRESRSSRDNPKRGWYVWRDPAPGGGPPNNWLSVFGGSAWEYDPATGQYYYHAYLREQPDLNWRHPEVQRAMLGVLRFWLDRGVDGFRVDVIWHLIKDVEFRDNPANPGYTPGQAPYFGLVPAYTTDRPEVHQIIGAMREVIDEYDDRLMIGEIYLPLERLVLYYGESGGGVHLPFNFQLIEQPWNARVIEEVIERYEASLPPFGWPNWVLGNHDKHRIASRVGPQQARVAAVLLLTLRGTPTLYYGDELGMHDVPIPPERVQDPWEKNVPGLGLGRDPARTPMQWSRKPNAGFTTGTPWLPVAEDYELLNIEAERDDPDSMLALYRRLIALRRAEPALALGSYRTVPASGDVLAYERRYGESRFLVVLNLGAARQSLDLGGEKLAGEVVFGTHREREGDHVHGLVELRANEAMVVRISQPGAAR